MSAPEVEETRDAPGPPGAPAGQLGRVTWQRLTVRPALIVAVLLLTWLWFRRARLDPVSVDALAHGQVPGALWRHVELTVVSTVLVLALALPSAAALTRGTVLRAGPVPRALVRAGRAVPALGLLGLAVLWLGTGAPAAVAALVAYAFLPVLSRTVAEAHTADPVPPTRPDRVTPPPTAPPPAVSPFLTALRTALVLNVGTATLAAFGGAGGLGTLISAGITEQRTPVLVLGSVLTLTLALLADWITTLLPHLWRRRAGREGSGRPGTRADPPPAG
ncbi:ABC transporter permease [Streptomyces sp. NPDC014864]|uniref:ABC transporter permease n=1 Tax=Streptomyces sp. NPDC014864 TaxID=3364924 RepID=UPI0036FB9C89